MAIAHLTGLHSLLSWTLPVDSGLPPGSYRRLRRLALPADVAGRSLGVLGAAEGLRELELSWIVKGSTGPSASQPALAALQWAARHPALQRLCTCFASRPAPAALLDAVTAAQRANPSLRIHSSSELHEGLLRGSRAYT